MKLYHLWEVLENIIFSEGQESKGVFYSTDRSTVNIGMTPCIMSTPTYIKNTFVRKKQKKSTAIIFKNTKQENVLQKCYVPISYNIHAN